MLTSEKKSEDNYIGIRTCVLIKSTIQQIDTIEGLRQVHSVERLVASLHKAFRPQSLLWTLSSLPLWHSMETKSFHAKPQPCKCSRRQVQK
mgnify:CR=1 FL=1